MTISGFDYEKYILSWDDLKKERERLGKEGKTVVFTNGAFDLLHVGHLQYLTFARRQGDCLIVGLNTDASIKRHSNVGVKRNKGQERPFVPQDERAMMLAGLKAVDYVVLFDEDEPKRLIEYILPDVLVKGEDWAHYVSGREAVEAHGGKVVLAKLVQGKSTTNLVDKIRNADKH